MDASAVKPSTPLPTETREMLERSFQNPHPTIRARAIEAAARLKTSAVLPLLEPLLSDPDPRVCSAASASFDALISPSDPELARAFGAIQSPSNRARIASLLSREHSSAGLALVGRLYELEPAAEVRSVMIRDAATAAGSNAARVVLRALADRDVEVRQVAENLVREHPDWLRSEAATDALPYLEQAREAASGDSKPTIAGWSDRIRAAQVRQKMHETGMASVLALTTALRSRSALLRQATAEACRQVGDTRATAALVQALNDKSSECRRAAAAALHQFGWKAETEEQFAAFLVALRRFNSVQELGAAAVPALLNVVESNEPDVQAEAIECLARTHSIRAMPIIAGLLGSPHTVVRAAAARALKHLEWVAPTAEAAVAHAIALEDWAMAATHGVTAVEPLVAALKAACGDDEGYKTIASALVSITDPKAAPALAAHAGNGEVAQPATAALLNILQHNSAAVDDATLQVLAEIPDATQFTFTTDPRYARPVRSGFDVVNLDSLRAAAAAEITRRAEATKEPSP